MIILYFILWIIFVGNLTLESALFGIAIAIAIFAFVCAFMDYSLKKELKFYKNIFRGIGYAFLLVVEVVKANLFVMKMILTQKEEIEPMLVSFKGKLKTDVGRAFLANAITMTPGTITVTLEQNEYVVHCLDSTLAEGIDDQEFERRLLAIEGDEKND